MTNELTDLKIPAKEFLDHGSMDFFSGYDDSVKMSLAENFPAETSRLIEVYATLMTIACEGANSYISEFALKTFEYDIEELRGKLHAIPEYKENEDSKLHKVDKALYNILQSGNVTELFEGIDELSEVETSANVPEKTGSFQEKVSMQTGDFEQKKFIDAAYKFVGNEGVKKFLRNSGLADDYNKATQEKVAEIKETIRDIIPLMLSNECLEPDKENLNKELTEKSFMKRFEQSMKYLKEMPISPDKLKKLQKDVTELSKALDKGKNSPLKAAINNIEKHGRFSGLFQAIKGLYSGEVRHC